MSDKYGAKVVGLEEIYDIDMDIYAPCALGATVNDETIGRLKCAIIAGAANNQLANETVHGVAVKDRDILYVPDFMINAGGVINFYAEVKGLSAEWAMSKAEEIYNRTIDIIYRASEEGIPTYEVANAMAEERIEAMGKVKLPF